ncbi:hypothetical protein [Pedobacter sp. WC2423]|uniref:hypothetical protein n=1 Tax=Pedobacter sp. WC2423 TaxID=3234142 RepID=UPI003465F011
MDRELPKLKIGNTEFVIDVMNSRLIQAEKPDNIISFNDMEDKGIYYKFFYDSDTCNIGKLKDVPDRQLNQNFDFGYDSIHLKLFMDVYSYDENHVMLRIPQMVELDPEGMAIRCKIPVEELGGKADFSLLVDQKAYQRRRNNEFLPQINIAGDMYSLEPKTGVLHPVDFGSGLEINMGNLLKSDNGQNIGLYDLNGHCGVKVEFDINKKFPENIVAFELPNMIKLDPVGVALNHGLDMRSILRKYPIIEDYSAKISPVAESQIPKIIEKAVREDIRLRAISQIIVPKKQHSKKYKRGLN